MFTKHLVSSAQAGSGCAKEEPALFPSLRVAPYCEHAVRCKHSPHSQQFQMRANEIIPQERNKRVKI